MSAWFATLWAGCAVEAPLPADGMVAPVEAAAPCSTGCSGPAPAELEPLGDAAIEDWLSAMTALPAGAESLAADTLLFHAIEVLDFLDRTDAPSSPHVDWLRDELARDRVEIGFRLVSEAGEVLGSRDDLIDLGVKHHLLLQGTGDLGRADINGKVKRVGVKHLWARF